tara:strand:+ start:515 stop:697 length:183 start_codon:yes stop_codon:yes gene_type:complete
MRQIFERTGKNGLRRFVVDLVIQNLKEIGRVVEGLRWQNGRWFWGEFKSANTYRHFLEGF